MQHVQLQCKKVMACTPVNLALNNIASGYGIAVECHKNDLLAREYNSLLFWADWCISIVLQNRKKKKRERERGGER